MARLVEPTPAREIFSAKLMQVTQTPVRLPQNERSKFRDAFGRTVELFDGAWISPFRRAIDFDRVGWHAPAFRASKLDALRHCRSVSWRGCAL